MESVYAGRPVGVASSSGLAVDAQLVTQVVHDVIACKHTHQGHIKSGAEWAVAPGPP